MVICLPRPTAGAGDDSKDLPSDKHGLTRHVISESARQGLCFVIQYITAQRPKQVSSESFVHQHFLISGWNGRRWQTRRPCGYVSKELGGMGLRTRPNLRYSLADRIKCRRLSLWDSLRTSANHWERQSGLVEDYMGIWSGDTRSSSTPQNSLSHGAAGLVRASPICEQWFFNSRYRLCTLTSDGSTWALLSRRR